MEIIGQPCVEVQTLGSVSPKVGVRDVLSVFGVHSLQQFSGVLDKYNCDPHSLEGVSTLFDRLSWPMLCGGEAMSEMMENK